MTISKEQLNSWYEDRFTDEKICTCGDTEMQHVDGEAQCAVPGCGCKEFEEQEECKMCSRVRCNCDEQYETYRDQAADYENN